MIIKHYFFALCLVSFLMVSSQTVIKDSETQYPTSYATISFGNGQGIFADDEGSFIFTKKLYPDIDSLYISALGYKNLNVATANLPNQLFLESKIDELDEVIVSAKIDRKYKVQKMKPYLDDDYYKCWLPTIESEIAVFFKNDSEQLKKVNAVQFPIALESSNWKKRKRSNADKKSFSTLFKVMFYKNENGFPGKALNNEVIVFRVTEKNGDSYVLDVNSYDIFIPKSGVFVSIQVLGYTDKAGKLLPNKKYKEIKGRDGIVKIPTNFRPLLPFTDEISEHKTYVKRVFVNGDRWVKFKQGNMVAKSNLLNQGLNNYGIGMNVNVYKDE